MQVQRASQSFGPVSAKRPQVVTTSVTFPASVTQALAVLTSFLAEFSQGKDRPAGELDVRVTVPPGGVKGSTVAVDVTLSLRDGSDDGADECDGTVYFSVFGD